MARLPSFADLSGPVSLRSGRMYASADASAAGRGLSALGQGIEGLAAGLKASEDEDKRKRNAVDIARAEAFKTEGLLKTQNEFDYDPDYSTYSKRAPAKTGEVVKTAANLIRDPEMRERWTLAAQSDAARVNDGIFDKGERTKRDAEIVGLDDALETSRRIYVDPNTPDDVRAKAKKDIDGAIAMGSETGLLTPEAADARRKKYIEDAEFSRGKLAVERDPSIISHNRVSGSIPPEGAALLDTIAGTESGGAYNVLNGGERFSSFADHPRRIGKGGTATAAGRYQFVKGTWDRAAKALGLTDFSPESQDKAAWWLAQSDYAAKTGRDLLTDLRSPDENTKAGVRRALSSTWEGLKSLGDGKFASKIEAGPKANPDWYNAISPEQRAAIDQQAQNQQIQNDNASAAMFKAQQGQARDDFNLRIATADPTLTQQEILSSAVIDNGDKATLINSLNAKMKDQVDTAEAIRQFAAGTLSVDPFDEKGRKTVDNVYDAAVKAVGPEKIQPLTEEMVRQTGVVPKGAMSNIRAGLQSTDIAQVTGSLQAAQRLSAINPAALGRQTGGNEVQTAADDFKHYVDDLNLSPDMAARRIMEARDPAKQRERKAIEPAAKEFVKSLSDFDLAGQFNDSWFGGDPSLGVTPAQELGIKADFLAIAEDQFYRANGDPELAKSRAVEEMKRLYGVTTFGGADAVVKHPPERYWPKSSLGTVDRESRIGGSGGQGPGNIMGAATSEPSLDYARKQLQADITTMEPDADLSTVQLVTTPETDAQVKRGELPGYAVLYKDKNGVYQTIPGKLWRPDISKAKAVNQVEEAERKEDRERNARVMQDVERGKAERVNRPTPTNEEVMTPPSAQDILSGNDPVFGAR